MVCLQETKLKPTDEAVAEAQLQASLPSWRFYWNSSTARQAAPLPSDLPHSPANASASAHTQSEGWTGAALFVLHG